MKALLRVERDFMKKRIPQFSVGDTVRVHVKVVEGDKVRNQVFQGTVVGRRGGGLRETFTVRKISSNVAVERTFPIHSPSVVKIEMLREGRVRRAQLTYMRDRKGKRARIAGRQVDDAARAASGDGSATEGASEGEAAEAAETESPADAAKAAESPETAKASTE